MKRTSSPAPRSLSKRLEDQILAVLSLYAGDPPMTAGAIAQRTPLATDPHQVSQRLYDLVRHGAVIRIGKPGARCAYRLADGVQPPRRAIDEVTSTPPRPYTLTSGQGNLLRRLIRMYFEQDQAPKTKAQIAAHCSGWTQHEVAQKLYELQRDGVLASSSGPGRKLFWLSQGPQTELPLGNEDRESAGNPKTCAAETEVAESAIRPDPVLATTRAPRCVPATAAPGATSSPVTAEQLVAMAKMSPTFPIYIELEDAAPARQIPVACGRAALVYGDDSSLVGVIVGLSPNATKKTSDVRKTAETP